jgi:hypothetical protein
VQKEVDVALRRDRIVSSSSKKGKEREERTILTLAASAPTPLLAPLSACLAALTFSTTFSLTPITNCCCCSGSALTAKLARNLQTGSSSPSVSGREANAEVEARKPNGREARRRVEGKRARRGAEGEREFGAERTRKR